MSYVVLAPHHIDPVLRGVEEGLLPRHLAAGIDGIAARGGAMRIVEPSGRVATFLARRGSCRAREGQDLLQLARATRAARRSDATVYGLWEQSLARSRWSAPFGRWRPPAIALVHDHCVGGGLVRSIDGALCLTERAADNLTALGHPAVLPVSWGPDLGFSGYRGDPPATFSVASLGRTGRDIQTLMEAIAVTGVDAVVEVREGTSMPPTARTLVSVARGQPGVPCGGDRADGSYARPVAGFAFASVFVIPLLHPFTTPVGLTELNDALALGRPVVMTRTPGLGIDVEAEKIGLWVDPGDGVAMAAAIRRFRDDPGLRVEYGRNARRLAEQRWNYATFLQQVDSFLTTAGFPS